MRVTYDAATDAAYIYLDGETWSGGVADTVPVDPLVARGMINLDFDREDRLVGIEVLAASRRLPRSFLEPHAGSD
ncbi:DUF2283 domain-containing protein [Cellulomonas sp. APG4]|uniref:DUF2283 domain-containing protein n=1 Tax=Cellulomonas sp. APG4 TaxID=1538656 RepID=UPI00351BB1EA